LIYLDTSFLAPFYIQEATSDRIETVLLSLPAGELTISDWTKVEFASLLMRRVRMGELAPEMLEEIMHVFQEDVAQSYITLAVSRRNFERASEMVLHPETGLRAGDALHLAIAEGNQSNRFLTLDKGMLKAAQVLGIKADSGGIYDIE
jgi:hypothetical protein